MSHISRVSITYNSKGVTFVSLLKMLLSEGWNLNDHGAITYIPLEAEDASDWKRVPLSDESTVWEVIQEKEIRGELIGLVIIWEDLGPGCAILYEEKGTISFGLSINRKLASRAQRYTDVTWYLEHLVPIFSSYKVGIELVEWREYPS